MYGEKKVMWGKNKVKRGLLPKSRRWVEGRKDCEGDE